MNAPAPAIALALSPTAATTSRTPTPSLEDIAAESSAFARSLEPADLAACRDLAKALRGSCAVPMISRGRDPNTNRLLPREPMSEADILGVQLLGRSLGLGVMQALNGIHVVEGRVTLAARTMTALVRQSPSCVYLECEESTHERCTFVTRRRGSTREQRITWTLDDARRAGLLPGRDGSNWQKYPAAMLRARASADLCGMVYSDVLLGLSSTEELADEPDATIERIGQRVDLEETKRRGEAEAAAAAAAAAPPKAAPSESKEKSVDRFRARLAAAQDGAELDRITAEIGATKGELSKDERAALRAVLVERRAAVMSKAAPAPAPAPATAPPAATAAAPLPVAAPEPVPSDVDEELDRLADQYGAAREPGQEG